MMPMQMTLDHALARMKADIGMRLALENAERADPNFPEQALRFFEAFCRSRLYFTTEDVVAAWKAFGLRNPPNDKAWGAIVQKARRAGFMEQDGFAKRAKGNGSPAPRWKSKIFCEPAPR